MKWSLSVAKNLPNGSVRTFTDRTNENLWLAFRLCHVKNYVRVGVQQIFKRTESENGDLLRVLPVCDGHFH